jgi:hypothetical protein
VTANLAVAALLAGCGAHTAARSGTDREDTPVQFQGSDLFVGPCHTGLRKPFRPETLGELAGALAG